MQKRVVYCILLSFFLFSIIQVAAQELPGWSLPFQLSPTAYSMYPKLAVAPDGSFGTMRLEQSASAYVHVFKKFTAQQQPLSDITVLSNVYSMAYPNIVADQQGNYYVISKSGLGASSIYITKLDNNGNVIFQRDVTAPYNIPVAVGDPHLVIGSDGNLDIFFATYTYAPPVYVRALIQYMRVSSLDGTALLSPTIIPYDSRATSDIFFGLRLVVDLTNGLIFLAYTTSYQVFYAKINELDGSVLQQVLVDQVNEPYRIGAERADINFNSRQGNRLYVAWSVNTPIVDPQYPSYLNYALYDTDTGQALSNAYRFQLADNPWTLYGIAGVTTSNDGSRVSILWGDAEGFGSPTPQDDKILLTQLDSITRQRLVGPLRLDTQNPNHLRARGAYQLLSGHDGKLYVTSVEWPQWGRPLSFIRLYRPEIRPNPRPGRSTPRPNSQMIYFASAPLQAGEHYLVAASFTTQPPIILPGGIQVPLAFDPLFWISIASDVLINNRVERLDTTGTAVFYVNIPNVPIGTRFYLAFVAYNDQNEISAVSIPFEVTVMP